MSASRKYCYLVGTAWLIMLAVSLRFDRPEFRPWEYLKSESSPSFLPDRHIEMEEIGDLGYLSWVSDLRVVRPTTFTTDSWGFRNTENYRRPRIVVVGDSFVVGTGLSDTETLTAQLAVMLGEPVYNYGMETSQGPLHFLRERRFMHHRPDVLVHAPAARFIKPFKTRKRTRPQGESFVVWRQIGTTLRDFKGLLDRDNGLGHAFKLAYNTTIYRLFGRSDVIIVDGEPALILPIERQRLNESSEARGLSKVVASVIEMDNVLSARGIDFVYCPIPESGTIYPEAFPRREQNKMVSPSFLDLLIKRTRSAGLHVVDLRPVFRRNRFPYLYQRDDTHWNARAVKLAAHSLAMDPLVRKALQPGR